MKTEQEMYRLILQIAQKDPFVRVVGLNGSRANKNSPRDNFQDYDIVFLVTEMQPFLNHPNWINCFGKRIILQTPESMDLFPPSLGGWFTYLMLFEDGNRIDLMLIPIEELDRYLNNDSLTEILLDKDNRIPIKPEPSDRDYRVKEPSASYFRDCCNEFWWISAYVAKGICRAEFLYAADHLVLMRKELLRMISWKIGLETDYQCRLGKNYKYLEQYLKQEVWKKLLSTFHCADYSSLWDSLFITASLFCEWSKEVANTLGYPYPQEEATMTLYLEKLKESWESGLFLQQ